MGIFFNSLLALVGGRVVGLFLGVVIVGFVVGSFTSSLRGQQSLPQTIWHNTICGF